MGNLLGIEAVLTEHKGIPAIVATVPGTCYGFIWQGGPYIDQIVISENGDNKTDNMTWFYGQECINVWDYGRNMATIPFEISDMISEIDEWITA